MMVHHSDQIRKCLKNMDTINFILNSVISGVNLEMIIFLILRLSFRKYPCQTCGKIYKTKTDLDTHSTKHSGKSLNIYTDS